MSLFADDDAENRGDDAGSALPAAEPDPKRERPGGRLVVGIVVGLVAVLAGGYVAAHYAAGDKVPRGTTVAGVDLGGLTPATAESALREEFEARVDDPIEVSVDERRTDEVTPSAAGLSIDYAATVDEAGAGRSWSLARQWDYFTGGDDVEPVVDVDEATLDDELARLSEGLGTPPVDGEVRFTATGTETTDPVPGRAIDTDEAAAAITEAFVSGDADGPIELSVGAAEPDIDAGDVQAALDEFANPAMTAPVTLSFRDTDVELSPADVAPALSMVPEDGVLVPQVDDEVLAPLVRRGTRQGEPVDATVALRNGKPQVVPGEPGLEFAPEAVADTLLGVLVAEEGERTAKVPASRVPPEFTTADARDLGITRQVSTFTTYFPYAEYRNVNIGRAGELINGTVLKPGETFSMNDVVGERTVENGFTTGTVISDGIFVEDLGGGVSQMATTTFNAAFFAGLEDVEHKPHSVYIDRYPVGREATVSFGSVDLRFKNDTDHGVLINVEVVPSTPTSQGEATVRMFSTKTFRITSRTSDRYDYVAPGTRTLRTDNCLPNTGYSGFSVDVWRDFRDLDTDEVVRSERFHTDYIPSDTVICKPPGGGGR